MGKDIQIGSDIKAIFNQFNYILCKDITPGITIVGNSSSRKGPFLLVQILKII